MFPRNAVVHLKAWSKGNQRVILCFRQYVRIRCSPWAMVFAQAFMCRGVFVDHGEGKKRYVLPSSRVPDDYFLELTGLWLSAPWRFEASALHL